MPLWASVLVTTTLTAPAAWAGVVAVIVVLLTNVTPVAAAPPTLAVAPDRNPVPVIVTAVPPLVVPVLGVIDDTVGAGFPPVGAVYVNPPLKVPLLLSGFVIVTSTGPAGWAGVVAVIVVLVTVTSVGAAPPSVTVAPDANPVPAMVTVLPPLVVPEVGVIEATVGAGLDGFCAGVLPPQLGSTSTSSNRELTGNQFLEDIIKECSGSQKGLNSHRWTSETAEGRGTRYPTNVGVGTDWSNFPVCKLINHEGHEVS